MRVLVVAGLLALAGCGARVDDAPPTGGARSTTRNSPRSVPIRWSRLRHGRWYGRPSGARTSSADCSIGFPHAAHGGETGKFADDV